MLEASGRNPHLQGVELAPHLRRPSTSTSAASTAGIDHSGAADTLAELLAEPAKHGGDPVLIGVLDG